jgi:hypothetical protein
MRTFSVGSGRVHALAYTPDGRSLAVDVRGAPAGHPMGFDYLPAHELVWWDWLAGTPARRFHLRDSLFGPEGACTKYGQEDWEPDQAAFDVVWRMNPLRVASA